MTDHEGLEPPKGPPVADPGAHQLAEASDSEDQFTDAQSGPTSPNKASPQIPKTRVERVDDAPSYGEVPGTQAHKMREEDAQPDEIAIISDNATPQTPLSAASGIIPATVVEEAPGDGPGPHSAEFEEKRKADATPDLVLNAEGEIKEIHGENNSDAATPPVLDAPDPAPPIQDLDNEDEDEDEDSSEDNEDVDQDEENGGDDFGDDFDDFEEGGEDDDFDDFEDGFQQADVSSVPASNVLPAQQAALPFPLPDFDGLDPDSVISTTEPYLVSLFPPEELDFSPFPPLSKDSSVFLNTRSASLWSQLVAPPPLAPPDWIRSRIRRLFLVSLGVPVDLDEILPASKQKKLVLPSLNVPSASPRTSSDSRSVSRLRQGEGNASSTSVDTQGKPSKRRRGPPPPPDLDLVTARYLCRTTEEALNGMTDEELKAHIAKLDVLQGLAKETLEYWEKRTDEKIGERDTFEGVIENLVKHARKIRK